jgi:hypothetical protein
MKFDLKKACPGCPFLNEGEQAVRLYRGRIVEIHNVITNWHGGEFPCHKTVDYDDESLELGDGRRLSGPGERHCAGALGYLANIDSDGPQHVKMAVYGCLKKKYEDFGPPEKVFDSLHAWKESAIDAEEKEPDCCETCEPGCLAPAGFMTAGGIEYGTEAADDECKECGAPTCSNCLSESGLCGLCDDWGEGDE